MNSGDSGIIRDLIHDVRYLCELLVNYSVFISVVLFLFLLSNTHLGNQES